MKVNRCAPGKSIHTSSLINNQEEIRPISLPNNKKDIDNKVQRRHKRIKKKEIIIFDR